MLWTILNLNVSKKIHSLDVWNSQVHQIPILNFYKYCKKKKYIYIYIIYRLLNKALGGGGYKKQESGILNQRAESLFTKMR